MNSGLSKSLWGLLALTPVIIPLSYLIYEYRKKRNNYGCGVVSISTIYL